MKSIIAFLLCWSLPFLSLAAPIQSHHAALARIKAGAGGGGGPSYIINQNFEGTGYDNAESWTESGAGTINEDYTAAPLVGSQSLQFVCSSQSASTGIGFTQQDTVRCEFRLNITSFTGEVMLGYFATPGPGSARAFLFLESGGTLRIQLSSGPSNSCTDVLPTGTPLWVAFDFNAGSGGDATAGASWSTTSTLPSFSASGAKTCLATGGGEISQAGYIVIGNTDADTITAVYDSVTVQ